MSYLSYNSKNFFKKIKIVLSEAFYLATIFGNFTAII